MSTQQLTEDVSLSRLHTAEAIGTLVSVMRAKDVLPADRLRAANSLLERAHGKAATVVAGNGTRKAVSLQLAAMDDSDLLEVLHNARSLRLSAEGGMPPSEGPMAGGEGKGTPLPLADPHLLPANSLVPGHSADNPWD